MKEEEILNLVIDLLEKVKDLPVKSDEKIEEALKDFLDEKEEEKSKITYALITVFLAGMIIVTGRWRG